MIINKIKPRNILYKYIDKDIQKYCRRINKLSPSIWTIDSCDGHGEEFPYIAVICRDVDKLWLLVQFARDNNLSLTINQEIRCYPKSKNIMWGKEVYLLLEGKDIKPLE